MQEITRGGLALSAALALVAGYVDAIGFIETGGHFVSFMSGNSTQAGVELLEGRFAGFALSAVLVAAFVAGVFVGALAAGRPSDHRPRVVLAAAVALAAVALLDATGVGGPWRFALLAAAMGSLNTLYLTEERARVAITYATGTLVALGLALSALVRGRSRTAWRRPLLLWGSLAFGALCGAAAVQVAEAALSLAVAAAVLVALAAALLLRRRGGPARA